jgi:hypothetical protein
MSLDPYLVVGEDLWKTRQGLFRLLRSRFARVLLPFLAVEGHVVDGMRKEHVVAVGKIDP